MITPKQIEYWESQIYLSREQIKHLENQEKISKEQISFLRRQKEFLKLQKQDLSENKENRESLNKFTFVIAFGVVVSIFFSLFQIVIQFKQASSVHLLIISAIFIFIFLFYIGFLFHVFPMGKEMISYFKKNWWNIIFILIAIIILGILLFLVPDVLLV